MKVLTERHLRAAEMLADGVSQRSIAKQLQVSEKTMRRWKEDPDFQKLCSELGLSGLSDEEKRKGVVTPLVVLCAQRMNRILGEGDDDSDLSDARLNVLERLARLLDKLVDTELKDQQAMVAKKRGRTVAPITRDPGEMMDELGEGDGF